MRTCAADRGRRQKGKRKKKVMHANCRESGRQEGKKTPELESVPIHHSFIGSEGDSFLFLFFWEFVSFIKKNERIN